MPSLVATTSTPARKPFVRTHYVRTNIRVPVADSIFICGHCSNSRTAYFCELVIIKVEATYYLQILDIVPALLSGRDTGTT